MGAERVGQTGIVAHPRGLYVLFFTELWERYSFYSMMAILDFRHERSERDRFWHGLPAHR